MVVKEEITPFERIRAIVKERDGLLQTSDLSKHGIPGSYLSTLEMKGEVQHLSRGVYLAAGFILDEMVVIQERYKGVLFSHEIAAFLLDLTDQTPLIYSVTVPSEYNATSFELTDRVLVG